MLNSTEDKFIMLINVGILKFISMMNTIRARLKARAVIFLQHLNFHEQLKCPAQLSWARKKFYKLRAWRQKMTLENLSSLYTMQSSSVYKITMKPHFWRKKVMSLSIFTQRRYGRFQKVTKIGKPLFERMALLHFQMRRHVINFINGFTNMW